MSQFQDFSLMANPTLRIYALQSQHDAPYQKLSLHVDILVVGAGLGGTGAAYEARYWGRNKKVIIAEKANIDRSGAVAQGLYTLSCAFQH
jgi:NADPH-dependent 2,4-dienoyl-CoA reductase/sulfur reductase-like enzyme